MGQQHGTNWRGNYENYYAFLTIFTQNLYLTFPNPDLNMIDYDHVRRLGDFSAVCSTIAYEAWNDYLARTQNVKRKAA